MVFPSATASSATYPGATSLSLSSIVISSCVHPILISKSTTASFSNPSMSGIYVTCSPALTTIAMTVFSFTTSPPGIFCVNTRFSGITESFFLSVICMMRFASETFFSASSNSVLIIFGAYTYPSERFPLSPWNMSETRITPVNSNTIHVTTAAVPIPEAIFTHNGHLPISIFLI